MPVIPAPGRLRQEGGKVKVSLGYTMRPYLKTTTKNTELIHS
jgi:hypothetical protein